MTQAEFDALLVWLAAEWADRHIAGEAMPVRWDELGLDLHRAVGGVVRFGEKHGMLTVSVAVGERLKAAVARAREYYDDETLYVRVDADG